MPTIGLTTTQGARLAGKSALITAAGAGIGRACATMMASEGASVIATDIDARSLDGLSGMTTGQLDVTDTAAVSQMAKKHGPIDILVLAAGYVANGSILDCEPADWDRSVSLNLSSMYQVARAFLPAMIDNGGGSIITISSVASSIRGVPDRFAYSTTKAGVIGLTKSIAIDFVGKGIRANAICPGTVDSPSLNQRMAATGDLETAKRTFAERQPMGRIGKPAEIAALAVYLASDESAFTTGAIHPIDGGWTM